MNATLSNSGLFYALVYCILRGAWGIKSSWAVQHIMRNSWHRELPAHFLRDPRNTAVGRDGSRVAKEKAANLTSLANAEGFLHLYRVCMERWARRADVAGWGLNWQIICLFYGETGKPQDPLGFAGGWEVCEQREKGGLIPSWLLDTAGRNELLSRTQESTPGNNSAKWRKETSKLKSDAFSCYKDLYQ